MYRYRDCKGSTSGSQEMADKHLQKVGDIQYIKGYFHIGNGKMLYPRVLVRGDRGSARFNGFSWGYRGTGPQGLRNFLLSLGLNNEQASCIAFDTAWKWEKGESWKISFQDGEPKIVKQKQRMAA